MTKFVAEVESLKVKVELDFAKIETLNKMIEQIQRTFQLKKINFDPILIKRSLFRQKGNERKALQDLTGCSVQRPFFNKNSRFKVNSEILTKAIALEKDTRTTLIIKNLPKKCTYDLLQKAIN